MNKLESFKILKATQLELFEMAFKNWFTKVFGSQSIKA